ncbi:hypothetical protein WH47_07688 [Habropoda laboriosa]|uniref:MADF domain-containing protein n=1 Tax=Habropoda laboriosa TaxID=597456 RepID=A0A0L7QPJ3_9HYME|nr:hypothetical protein WH47_07688 [Habropoda laboriosa]
MSGRKIGREMKLHNLITLYEEKSVLWNTKDVEYRNREKKEQIFTALPKKSSVKYIYGISSHLTLISKQTAE